MAAHVVRKAYFDFEKEEKFLNDMAANGLALKDYSWCKYIFEDAPKGEYIYRLELLQHPIDHPESERYIQFMEETGAEMITSYNRWAYFRKKSADGNFEIFSDNESRLGHYQRIQILLMIIIGLNFILGIYNIISGNMAAAEGFPAINTYTAIISFSIAALLLIFILLPLNKKIEFLKRERDIRE